MAVPIGKIIIQLYFMYIYNLQTTIFNVEAVLYVLFFLYVL
jgi:hypothetical protein